MQSYILRELQTGIVRAVRKKKEQGADVHDISCFLNRLFNSYSDTRIKLFVLVLITIEAKEANKNKNTEGIA